MKRSAVVGPRKSGLEDVPIPGPGDDGVVVRVRMSGICASELHTWEHGSNTPMALGHEVAGDVVAVGGRVDAFRPGDRVTGLFQKGFSEFAVATAERVVHVPDNVPDELAFGEPLACAVSAARRTEVELGDRIAMVGLGFMGQLMLKLLALKGPTEIVGIDPRADARRTGLAAGCTATFTPDEAVAEKLANFDVVVEASGTPDGLSEATALTREHGRLSILGYHQGGPRVVDMQLWNYRALEVLNAHERRVDYRMDCMRRGLALMAAGRLDLTGMATHSFPLSDVDGAFAALADKPAGFIKAIVVADDPPASYPQIPLF